MRYSLSLERHHWKMKSSLNMEHIRNICYIYNIYLHLELKNNNEKMTLWPAYLQPKLVLNYSFKNQEIATNIMFFIFIREDWLHLSTYLKNQMSSKIIKITNLTGNRWCCVHWDKLSINLENLAHLTWIILPPASAVHLLFDWNS